MADQERAKLFDRLLRALRRLAPAEQEEREQAIQSEIAQAPPSSR